MYKGKVKLDKVNKAVIVNSISPARKWTGLLNKLKDQIRFRYYPSVNSKGEKIWRKKRTLD